MYVADLDLVWIDSSDDDDTDPTEEAGTNAKENDDNERKEAGSEEAGRKEDGDGSHKNYAIGEETGLFLAETSDLQQYEALSYSWGRPDLTAPIFCNGVKHMIPPEMSNALRALRRHDQPRWLWCDAICINQQDAAEKSAQIELMFLIFRKAERTIAWLGPANVAVRTAFNVCRNMDPQDFQHKAKPADKAVLRELLDRQWFRRGWIRQEVYAAADNVLLQSDDLTLPFKVLGAFLHDVDEDGCFVIPSQVEVLDRDQDRKDELNAQISRRTDRLSRDDLAFWIRQMLHENCLFGFSDDKDRVHTVVAMARFIMDDTYQPNLNKMERSVYQYGGFEGDSVIHSSLRQDARRYHSAPLDVDCSKSLGEVYQDMTKYIINAGMSLQCLQVFRACPHPGDLPSWTLDWRAD